MVYVIAEAGVNHNGSLDLAYELIDKASKIGANAIKFQTFITENVLTMNTQKASYQSKLTDVNETQWEMIKKLELNFSDFEKLHKYSQKKEIEFLSTPFDIKSLNFLTKKLRLRTIKIPSGEITNLPFILEIAKYANNIILSTGMCNLSDIELALATIAFGLIGEDKEKNIKNFYNAYYSDKGQNLIKQRVKILHCTSEYPAPYNEINLNAIKTLKNTFNTEVGYSDHTQGIHIPLAAVTLGAEIIEKHFTIDKNLPGPDHKSSIEIEEFSLLIKNIKELKLSLGTGVKLPTVAEIKNRNIIRKFIVANKDIKKGETFTENNLTIKRSQLGLEPKFFWEIIGKKADKNYLKDDLITS